MEITRRRERGGSRGREGSLMRPDGSRIVLGVNFPLIVHVESIRNTRQPFHNSFARDKDTEREREREREREAARRQNSGF